MQRQFEPAEASFRQQVSEFFASNWPQATGAEQPDQSAWRRAVVAQGWSVPDWPESAGGPGWSPTQKFIWQQTCAAHGMDPAADPGVAIVGPLLLRAPMQAQGDAFLAGIRELRTRWCIGFAEPEAGKDIERMTTSVSLQNGNYVLNGVKTWVADAMDAHWMCALVRLTQDCAGGCKMYALLAVDMQSTGLSIRPVKTLDGSLTMADVLFEDVVVPGDRVLAGPGDGQAYAQIFIASEYSTLSQSAVAAAQLEVLDEVLLTFDPADDLHAKRDALAVDLSGLEALELRFLDALVQSAEPPFPLMLLRLKSREILLQLGALQVECFGYYALPYPDEMLLHNEGPVGPAAATTTMRGMLARQVAALYSGRAEQARDEMVRHLGIDDD